MVLQVKCLCVLMFLSFPLTMAEVPGPCRHSITREHLLTVRHLMDNQLRNGCSITYTFIERRSLSNCCFVKAALPWILELLTTHFKYSRGSVNDGYVQSLRALILNIYSQKCVPQINEEVEDKPESFEMLYRGSPSEALQKASEVLSVYWELVTRSDAPVDWRCQNEYTEVFSSTTELPTESSAYHFTGGNLYPLENNVMNYAAVGSHLDHRYLVFLCRQLWSELSEGLAQKASQGPVQVGLHHHLCLRRTAVHTHSLLSHYTKENSQQSQIKITHKLKRTAGHRDGATIVQ
uniref:Colony stimulating factor 1b (macrophage) n=1 Tax=Sparus aurata TaxID=8175 RepID=A0A671X5P5_SPAAU